RNLAFVTLGWGYLPLLLSHFLLIQRDLPGGAGLLVVLALSVALSDVGAYCFGTFFGKHKLAPTISPHKTWEGVAGNAVGAAVGVVLTRYALPPELPEAARWLLPAVIALAAVWGDLVESALKREFAVKDTGVWLPGFGGLLDRIDSLIFLVPIGYHYFRFAMGPGHGS
ncbi:MAG: phosphatidate cytidylyltransferase, partial [Chloroflexota bacterium]